jgi:protein TonB
MAAHTAHALAPFAGGGSSVPPFHRFRGLDLVTPESRSGGLSWGFVTSLFAHAILLAAVILVPVLSPAVLPEPGVGIKAFFATPPEIAPAPPPPPPAAPRAARALAPTRPIVVEPPRFVAPIAVPEQVKPETEGLSLLGVEGGVPGGVEGGVPGGVVGGVVGGLPLAPPPLAERQVVRIGGAIVAPRLLRRVAPEYPLLAQQVRVMGTVVAEARVDTEGRVRSVVIVSGHPLFAEAVIAAVAQWRYQPLLLNGVPTEFILSVSLNFNLLRPEGK